VAARPGRKTVEVHALGDDRRWRDVRVYVDDVRVHAAPFAAIVLDLAAHLLNGTIFAKRSQKPL
jgi:hypothetical protein